MDTKTDGRKKGYWIFSVLNNYKKSYQRAISLKGIASTDNLIRDVDSFINGEYCTSRAKSSFVFALLVQYSSLVKLSTSLIKDVDRDKSRMSFFGSGPIEWKDFLFVCTTFWAAAPITYGATKDRKGRTKRQFLCTDDT